VIWTDESLVELEKNSCVIHVWRWPGEEYLDKCLASTFKSGQTSIMVWSCITYNCKGLLYFLPKDQQKGVDYIWLILAGPLWDTYMRRWG